MIKPLDVDTFQRVTMIIDRARRSGANVPTRLNDAQLIWTKERERHHGVTVLRDLLQEFDIWMPHEFLRLVNRELVNCTPTDMHMAIRKWLGDYLDHARKQ